MIPLTKCATERFPVRSGSLLFWNWKSRSNTFSVTLGRRDRKLYQYRIIAFILNLFKRHGVVDLLWVAREGSRWRVQEVSTWADTGGVDQVQTAPRATARVLKWTNVPLCIRVQILWTWIDVFLKRYLARVVSTKANAHKRTDGSSWGQRQGNGYMVRVALYRVGNEVDKWRRQTRLLKLHTEVPEQNHN